MANNQQLQSVSESSSPSSPPMTAIAKHDGVRCDECGVRPLMGIRYKARHICDFDLCEACMNEHSDTDKRNNYVAFDQPIARHAAARLAPPLETQIRANSFRQAAEAIGRNDRTMQVAKIRIYSSRNIDVESDGEALRSALASNTHLRILHIRMCHSTSEAFGTMIVDMAKGIMSNTCIKRIFWSLPQEQRNERTATALREMMERNSVVKALFFKINCEYADPAKNDGEAFAQQLAKGLEINNSIKRFRLDKYTPLSESTKETMIASIKKNQTIERLYVDLQKNDGRLELLLADNRQGWKRRFSDTKAPVSARLDVLVEATTARDYHHDWSHVDPVAAAYHLVRGCPEFVSPVSRDEGL